MIPRTRTSLAVSRAAGILRDLWPGISPPSRNGGSTAAEIPVTLAPASAAGVGIRRAELLTVVTISLQLALVLLVVREYQLESRTFFNVMVLGAVGFVSHALLPLRLRLSFFPPAFVRAWAGPRRSAARGGRGRAGT